MSSRIIVIMSAMNQITAVLKAVTGTTFVSDNITFLTAVLYTIQGSTRKLTILFSINEY